MRHVPAWTRRRAPGHAEVGGAVAHEDVAAPHAECSTPHRARTSIAQASLGANGFLVRTGFPLRQSEGRSDCRKQHNLAARCAAQSEKPRCAARSTHAPCVRAPDRQPVPPLVQPSDAMAIRHGIGPGMTVLARLGRHWKARRVGARGKVIVVNVQPRLLARVRRRAAAAGLRNLAGHLADIRRFPFADDTFDAIYPMAVVRNALRELRRVLKAWRTRGAQRAADRFGVHAAAIALSHGAGGQLSGEAGW